ncbi:MAG: TonB-dependent receptor [Bacteroidales bacterium]|nr:TonB-dependent receptor [Bacteroidales bacterium]
MTKSLKKGFASIAILASSFFWALSLSAQNPVTVSGQIVDEANEPVIGAGVMQKGTSTGAVTDLDGYYTLRVPEGSTLVFSCIGYLSQEIVVPAGGGTLNLTLATDNMMIEETVVVGYGVQKKSDLTGAISSVKSSDLTNRATSDIASLMQGKTAGVQVVHTGGAPGSVGTIRVRGVSSNGSSAPLYIVDGLKVPSLDFVNSENIESMEVLKDGASAAIYGAEAGNGVILVTTKKAKAGDGMVFFNAQYGISSLAKKVEMLNAKEYIDYMLTSGATTDLLMKQNYYDIPSVNGSDTDWQDLMYKKGYNQKYTLGVQGANDKGSFYVALSYEDQDGMLTGSYDTFNSFSSQANGSYKIKKWLTVGMTNTIQRTKSKSVSQSNVATGFITGILQYDPLTPVTYKGGLNAVPYYMKNAIDMGYTPFVDKETGDYYGSSFWNQSGNGNPMAMLKFRHQGDVTVTRINGTFYTDITPIKNLVFTSRFGYRITDAYNYSYEPTYWMAAAQYATNIDLNTRSTQSLYYQWENFANYSFSAGKNDFTAMAGMSFIRSKMSVTGAKTDSLINDAENYRYMDYSSTAANDTVSGNITESGQLSYFGRLTWGYDNRYNVMFNFRADAYDSSKLHPSHRWGYFPSISAGWTLTNEEFMKNFSQSIRMSFFKIRASYGINGNVSNLNNYAYASTVQNGNNYFDTDHLTIGTYPSDVKANNTLRWEKSKQVDLGIDARFFSDRLTIGFDYFDKNTDGLLVSVTPPLTTGSTSMMKNLGNVNNHGFEVDLHWKDQIGKDFTYDISANLSTVKNKVTKFRGEDQREAGASVYGSTVTYFEEGYPVWYFRTYEYLGPDKANGKPIIKDNTGEGNITEEDKTFTGSPLPDFTYGLNLSLAYKNFDLIVSGTGSKGGKLMLGFNRNGFPLTNRFAFEYRDAWKTGNTDAYRPAPTDNAEYYASDAWLFDASFFKIKQIQLGYSIPSKLLSKINVNKCRVFVSFDDFFTFTKYPGMDPETRSGTTNAMGIDAIAYPIQKSVLFGVNVAF